MQDHWVKLCLTLALLFLLSLVTFKRHNLIFKISGVTLINCYINKPPLAFFFFSFFKGLHQLMSHTRAIQDGSTQDKSQLVWSYNIGENRF
jgi:hypothetical protein